MEHANYEQQGTAQSKKASEEEKMKKLYIRRWTLINSVASSSHSIL